MANGVTIENFNHQLKLLLDRRESTQRNLIVYTEDKKPTSYDADKKRLEESFKLKTISKTDYEKKLAKLNELKTSPFIKILPLTPKDIQSSEETCDAAINEIDNKLKNINNIPENERAAERVKLEKEHNLLLAKKQSRYKIIIYNPQNKPALFSADPVGELITEFTLQKEHELAAILYFQIKKENDRHARRKEIYIKAGVSLLVGLALSAVIALVLASGVITLPVLLLSPLLFPILIVQSAFALGTFIGWVACLKILDINFRRNDTKLAIRKRDEFITVPPETYTKPWWLKLLAPIHTLNAALKKVSRLLVNNPLFKLTVGNIIAFFANSGNNHYTTEPSDLSGTLGPLIFAGCLHKPEFSCDNIYLNSILSDQYIAFAEFQKQYLSADAQQPFKRFNVMVNHKTVLACYKTNNYTEDSTIRNNADKKVTIYFCGNSSGAPQLAKTVQHDLESFSRGREASLTPEQIQQLLHDKKITEDEAKLLGPQDPLLMESIIFSYPGILNSTGEVKSAEDIKNAAIGLINDLLSKGYLLENINFDGMSLGGAIETQVADHFNWRKDKNGQWGKLRGLHASRTFSSTQNIGTWYVAKQGLIGRGLSMLFYPFILFGLWATNNNMFTGLKYFFLDNDTKMYDTVLSPREVRQHHKAHNLVLKDDDVLPSSEGGLHSGLMTRLQRTIDRVRARFLDIKKEKTLLPTEKFHENVRRVKEIDHKGIVVSLNENGAVLENEICGHSHDGIGHSGGHIGDAAEEIVVAPAEIMDDHNILDLDEEKPVGNANIVETKYVYMKRCHPHDTKKTAFEMKDKGLENPTKCFYSQPMAAQRQDFLFFGGKQFQRIQQIRAERLVDAPAVSA